MRKTLASAFLLGAAAISMAQTLSLSPDNIDKILREMTLEEKATVVVGETNGYWGQEPIIGKTESLVPGVAGTTQGVARLGITQMALADGPAGVRVSTHRDNGPKTYYTTGIPVASNLASSWNTDLLRAMGEVMGNEALEYGVDIILAPAINIMRNPLCGRNFEYYSEDPYLTGKLAAAYIDGAQSQGIGVSLKHFAANNQETNRNENNAVISPRALREIYLRGFEIAVKESSPWTIMSSYNRLNGPYTQENRELLTDILRDEWGFDGVVMTDWIGQRDTAAQITAGNDLMEPGSMKQTDELIAKVKSGELKEEYLDSCVKRILQLIVKTPRFKKYDFSNDPDLTAHAGVARNAATEGIILLKNNDRTLPLDAGGINIALFGVTSYQYIPGGTGSGDLDRKYVVGIEDALAGNGFQINRSAKRLYDSYTEFRSASADKEKVRPEELAIDNRFIRQRAIESDVAIITIGRNGGEGSDRRIDGDFNLTSTETNLIRNVSDAFHAVGKKVIVILNVFGVVETSSWKSYPDAILLAWQGGQEGGNALADILSGAVNPSGKLTMTFPISAYDHPSTRNFPTETQNRRRRGEPVRDIDYTLYDEDIYIGYRYFFTAGKEVSYPFGYGLSYTDFRYSKPKIRSTADGMKLSVTVTNTGDKTGKEIVQIYVSAPEDGMEKPDRELKAFGKTGELKPGESQTMDFTISDKDLASFDESSSSWITAKGEYKVLVGASSADIRHTLLHKIGKPVIRKCHDVLHPDRDLNRLHL